ncbi:short-chain dehydrogenase/reductase SDR [Halenospora varia]|nr:short-chain dehydrogenase/reductase SDR [Halenospora varia]
MGGFLGFLYRQLTFKPKPLPLALSLTGKRALITGANSGLGFEAAIELASHHLSHLILAVRDVAKGEIAKAKILASSPTCSVEVWELDYGSYDSVIEFSKRVEKLDRLDFVLLNAGVKMMSYVPSNYTHETNLQINHLSTSLLSLLLLPTLRLTSLATTPPAPTRLTIVSSEGHFWIPFHERLAPSILARMDEEGSFGKDMDRYYTTKLLNVLWTRELAGWVKEVGGEGKVVVNTVNPGFCHSGLHRHVVENAWVMNLFLRMFGWTSKQGVGVWWMRWLGRDMRGGDPSPFVLSEEGEKYQKQVWDETIELLKKEALGADLSAFTG